MKYFWGFYCYLMRLGLVEVLYLYVRSTPAAVLWAEQETFSAVKASTNPRMVTVVSIKAQRCISLLHLS